jgi:K+-sensing histidine kinase KdpD
VGLGLYYVYTLAEALGAALVLEDRSIGGAIARITLPAVAATAGATAASDEEAIAPTAVRAGATP